MCLTRSFSSSKRSFALNMKDPRARSIALRLAEHVSIVASNFRPGVLEQWGLSYEAIYAVNPRIIYLTMPMQGSDGPHAAYSGFGSTISALSGLVSLSGLPGRPPVGTGTHFPDHVPNPGHALVALLAALLHQRRTGEGQSIEVSQLESTINVLGPAIVETSMTGFGPSRVGNRSDGSSPRGVFPCLGEDVWCAISCRTDHDWQALTEILGHPEWANDHRFGTLLNRKLFEDELERIIADSTKSRDRGQLMAALRGHGVPAAPVNSSRDVLADPNLIARGYWQRMSHPIIGDFTIARPPLRVEGDVISNLRRPPLLGEHTAEIAREILDLTDDEIERLVGEGVMA